MIQEENRKEAVQTKNHLCVYQRLKNADILGIFTFLQNNESPCAKFVQETLIS